MSTVEVDPGFSRRRGANPKGGMNKKVGSFGQNLFSSLRDASEERNWPFLLLRIGVNK